MSDEVLSNRFVPFVLQEFGSLGKEASDWVSKPPCQAEGDFPEDEDEVFRFFEAHSIPFYRWQYFSIALDAAMAAAGLSNIEAFLTYTAPCVPRKRSEKMTEGPSTYFLLEDLWYAHPECKVACSDGAMERKGLFARMCRRCYNEWSAFGAEVPVSLEGGEAVMQYYVPFLSALQLFGLDGQLFFEYFEDRQPYGRAPLSEKVSELMEGDPNFASLQCWPSSQLHPSSWFSVAWYPIYRIPMGPSLRELSACFLPYYHIRLPSPWESYDFPISNAGESVLNRRSRRHFEEAGPSTALCPFGLASYKLRSDFAREEEIRHLVHPMSKAARRWVDSRQVHHPDLSFFLRSGGSSS